MKFVTNSVKSCAARVGMLSEFERIPEVVFETPLVLIYTKGGSVPHLTKDVFKLVTTNPQVLSVSLPSTIVMYEAIKDLNTNFANFVAMKEHINCLTIHDPAQLVHSGFQQVDSIPMWSRNGKYIFSANKYMDVVEAFQPDIYVALCDGDTDSTSGRKRITKAVDRSRRLLEQCLARHSESKILKSAGILAAIEGGYDMEARTSSINNVKDHPVVGYVIDGLHRNGPDVKNISSEQIREIVEHTINLLPAEKLKVAMGCWNPITVLDLIDLGVDVFDTSYPYVSTQNSEALTFLCDHDDCNNMRHVISFTDDRHKDEFFAICFHCECYTCKHHTRAYLHHLHSTKEMLSMVLLMMHNVQHYLDFFKAIRTNVKNGTLDEYKRTIQLKFTKSDSNQSDKRTNVECES